ncbi:MAG: PEP-CTERM sorting domain-containing protein [Phycisphaerales bacterium JB063]
MLARTIVWMSGAALVVVPGSAFAANASAVVDYDLGSGFHDSYTDVTTALGETSRDTGLGFGANPPLYLSNPYGNPWRPEDWVSIGQGGHITLQLENYALELDDAPELNVLVFQQILTQNGQTWYDRQASVSVSENGTDWFQLNNGDAIDFDTPATGYVFTDAIPQDGFGTHGAIDPADLDQYVESDYGLPMPGTLDHSSLSAFEAGRADAYGLSGGGNWLDFSETGLSQVGYIRFDVAADAPAYFALDAVYLNNNAVGAPVPEPGSLALLALGAAVALKRRRRSIIA